MEGRVVLGTVSPEWMVVRDAARLAEPNAVYLLPTEQTM